MRRPRRSTSVSPAALSTTLEGNFEEQLRKAEVAVVQLADRAAEPGAGAESDDDPDDADEQRELDVVPAERCVAVPESLQRGDLGALHRERPRQRHVESERSHEEEDQRQQEPEVCSWTSSFSSAQWDIWKARGVAPESTVGLENAIDARDSVLDRDPRRQGDRNIVEPSLHVQGCGKRLLVHPEHTEPLVVGHQLARPDAVDVFRRKRHADNGQAAADGR